MNQDQWNNFTLFLIAFGFLIVSFIQPFMYANFEPEIPKEVLLAKDMVYTGDSLGGFIGVKPSVFLERFFGDKLFSSECKPVWDSCFKEWLADYVGVPVGNVFLINIIQELFDQGDVLLGLLVLLFSFIFPLSKIVMGLMVTTEKFEYNQNIALYKLLKMTSKWSMTDVFIVALAVTCFKAEKFHLHFMPSTGVYAFALATIISSFATMRLSKQLGEVTTFQPPPK